MPLFAWITKRLYGLCCSSFHSVHHLASQVFCHSLNSVVKISQLEISFIFRNLLLTFMCFYHHQIELVHHQFILYSEWKVKNDNFHDQIVQLLYLTLEISLYVKHLAFTYLAALSDWWSKDLWYSWILICIVVWFVVIFNNCLFGNFVLVKIHKALKLLGAHIDSYNALFVELFHRPQSPLLLMGFYDIHPANWFKRHWKTSLSRFVGKQIIHLNVCCLQLLIKSLCPVYDVGIHGNFIDKTSERYFSCYYAWFRLWLWMNHITSRIARLQPQSI